MLVLDTHAWIWWIGGHGCPSLSERVRLAVDDAKSLGISAISCVEVAWLVSSGRVAFDRDSLVWIKQSLARPRVCLLEITTEIAVTAADLEWQHKDPADRLIVATAIHHKAVVATKDEEMHAFGGVQTIW